MHSNTFSATKGKLQLFPSLKGTPPNSRSVRRRETARGDGEPTVRVVHSGTPPKGTPIGRPQKT